MLTNFFTIPNATTTIAEAYEAGNPFFQALLPVAYVSIGVFVGVICIIFLFRIISGFINKLINRSNELTQEPFFNVHPKQYYRPYNWNPHLAGQSNSMRWTLKGIRSWAKKHPDDESSRYLMNLIKRIDK